MIRVEPDAVGEAWKRLGRGDHQGAARISGRVLVHNPEDVSALNCHAMARWQLGGDIGACIAEIEAAVRLAPDEGALRNNLAILLASRGDHRAARENFRTAIALRPTDTEAFYGLTQSYRFTEEEPLLKQMLGQYTGGRLTRQQQEFVCFGLAKAYDDLGLRSRAMHFCIEANWLGRRPYDADGPRAELDELRRLTAGDAFRGAQTSGHAARPLFIVGMPRSGTTLVESILARHPQVFAGGEMVHMLVAERKLMRWARANLNFSGGPHELVRVLPAAKLAREAGLIVKKVTAGAGAPFVVFTDKLPENTQRLGLVRSVFPNARVVYVRRHAIDCCLSNFFQRFALGHGYSFRQTALGERYRQVSETMHLWKQSLDLEIMDVSYEALVSNPEPSIRRILAFAGLDWDDACLSPELATRRILTASQFQVRQPINAKSVGRWHGYAEWIVPLVQALGGMDWIEAEQAEIATAHC